MGRWLQIRSGLGVRYLGIFRPKIKVVGSPVDSRCAKSRRGNIAFPLFPPSNWTPAIHATQRWCLWEWVGDGESVYRSSHSSELTFYQCNKLFMVDRKKSLLHSTLKNQTLFQPHGSAFNQLADAAKCPLVRIRGLNTASTSM